MKRIISLPPNYFYGCTLICVLFYFVFEDLRIISYPNNLYGFFFIAIGIFFILNPWYSFQKHNTPEDFSESTALVKDGIYKYSRNPMYLGGILALTGLAITTGNLLAFIAPFIFYLVMEFMFIPYEEQKLHMTFGEEYLKYKSVVRRWL